MGSGIAINIAQHNIEVLLFDVQADNVSRAQAGAQKHFARQVEKGRMSQEAADAANALIRPATELKALSAADLIIEAVFEDFDLKARLFKELSDIRSDQAFVATNTSCLRVSDLQQHDRLPARFLGMHYFSPAQINPIVEVVRGDATGEEAMEAALQFCRETSKQSIECKDSFGFAINRFFCPYTNEAVRVFDEGLGSIAAIDTVAKKALDVAAGPFQVMNLIKPRINLHAIRNLGPLGSFYAPAKSMIELGEADKSWTLGEDDHIDEAAAGTIGDRLMAGAFIPVLQALDEEVAAPEAFDLGARQALKMNKAPCDLMDSLGRDEVMRVIQPVLAQYELPVPASINRVGTLKSAG